MKRLKIILPSVALLCTLITFVSIVFSWYIVSSSTSDMGFTILQIDSLVTLYEANDTNYNGVPDLLPTSDTAADNHQNQYKNPSDAWVAYSNRYYLEKYKFTYLDQRYALSADSSSNLFNTISITDAAPSKIYSYKFEISNYISAQNALTFDFIEDSEIDKSILKDFQVRIGYLTSASVTDAPSIQYSSWTDFCTSTTADNVTTYSYSGISLTPKDASDAAVSMNVPSYVSDAGRRDIWLQIRINPSATTPISGTFKLPMYKLTLDASGSTSTATIHLVSTSVTSYTAGTSLSSIISAYDGVNKLSGTYVFTLNGEEVTTVAEGSNTYTVTFTPASAYGDKYGSSVSGTVTLTGTAAE